MVDKEKSIEVKLGDLMMQGWTLLADSCFKDSCNTPLMRDNETKQVYCVGCEAWVCNKEKKLTSHKFNQLVSLEGKRNVVLKNVNNEVSTIPKQHIPERNISLVDTLKKKLIELDLKLEVEQDVDKINKLLDAIKKCIDLLSNLANQH